MAIAGFVTLFVGLVLIICYPINKKKNARCAAQTQGTLSDIRRRYGTGGNLKNMHVYTYHVDGIEYQLRTLDHSPEAHRIGDVCTIWYNPAKPKDAQAFRGSDKYLKILLLVGVALLLLGILLFCLAFVLEFVL